MAIKHLIARTIHFDSLTLLACLTIAATLAIFFSPLGGLEMIGRPGNLRENNATIPVSLFKASAMLSAHNLQIERMAAARLRAACKALEVDRGRRGKTGLVIALLTLALLMTAPALAKPVAHRGVFYKTLRARKPPVTSVPWALRARSVTMSADPCDFRRCEQD
jgi:hypothetical protein